MPSRISHFALLTLVLACLVTSVAPAAEQKPLKGDLAEYTSGMGPTLGEIVDGPDLSGYYMLDVPGTGGVWVHPSKLRLVQRAGAPQSSMKPGEIVDVRSASGPLRAKVVKVNGAWCQLEAPGTVGWAECKELKPVKAGAQAPAESAEAAPAPKPAASGPSPLKGTYANADSSVQIEFKPKGKAFFSLQGMTMECTHRGSAKAVVLTCDGEDTDFTVDDDGALRGPPDSLVARMKKK